MAKAESRPREFCNLKKKCHEQTALVVSGAKKLVVVRAKVNAFKEIEKFLYKILKGSRVEVVDLKAVADV